MSQPAPADSFRGPSGSARSFRRWAKMVARAAPGGAVLSGGGGTPPSPLVGASWRGADDPTVAPPDTYGAIGPRSYVEIINRKIAVFDRSGRTIAAAGLGAVMPAPPSAIADPQILWDPLT